MLKFLISSFLLFILIILNFSSSFGQARYIPTALRVGTDLTLLGGTLLGTGRNQYELNTDLQFGKYFFAVDYGMGSRQHVREDFNYEFQGSYFRIGFDYNFIPEDPDINLIFAGLRYGRAFYSDNIIYHIEDDIFGNYSFGYENPSLNGRWIEVVAGMKIRVWNQLFLGYTLRYKLFGRVSGANNFSTYIMPGFGRAANSNTAGFNYHIFYRIPFNN
ncbi:DUF6048 family protein [soil metagenome]